MFCILFVAMALSYMQCNCLTCIKSNFFYSFEINAYRTEFQKHQLEIHLHAISIKTKQSPGKNWNIFLATTYIYEHK